MSEFLFSYGLFLAKGLTFVLLFGLVVGIIIIASSSRNQRGDDSSDELSVVKLNDRLNDTKELLHESLMDEFQANEFHKAEKKRLKKESKEKKKAAKLKNKSTSNQSDDHDIENKRRVFVLNFDGDTQASEVDVLRREVTAVLSCASENDEIVIRLESPGGQVSGYGLAAAQLDRIKQKNVSLTVCVDQVAASGGYMMACVANKIVAAPFSIVGSIGVVAQLPNFHRLLKKNDIDFEMHTAGAYKRTLTVMGENTDEGREKFKEELEDIHEQFKNHIAQYRPSLDLDVVATGEFWLGNRALDLNLIDQLMTSDQYLIEACDNSDVYMIAYKRQKTFIEKLGLKPMSSLISTGLKFFQSNNVSVSAKNTSSEHISV